MNRLIGGALLLFVCACAARTTSVSVTTAPTTTTTAPPSTGATAVAMFQSCMTASGFELDEVSVSEDGRPDLSSLAGEAATNLEFRQAMTLCAGPLREFLRLGNARGLQIMVVGELQSYAECMRASGVEDFPDPVPSFDGAQAPFPPEQIPIDDPDFGPAVEACAAALGVSP